MKTCILALIVLVTVTVRSAASQQAQKPLTKQQIIDLVSAGMDNTALAKLVRERDIDFQPTEEDLKALQAAGAKEVLVNALRSTLEPSLTADQVLKLVAGGVPNPRVAMLVKQRGISFVANETYLETVRLAGTDKTVIAALREASASAAMASLVLATSPGAEVWLDGKSNGPANAQGELALKSPAGAHQLRVTLAGKLDFNQSITLAAGQVARIEARLADVPGSIRVRTLPGAGVKLDKASRGSTTPNGELVLSGVSPGAHELWISATGKVDDVRAVTVATGSETLAEIRLLDSLRVNPQDTLTYVWISPGTFTQGCSAGDGDCGNDEKPAHPVTLSKGFWMGQTKVTVGAYVRFAAATGQAMPPHSPKIYQDWTNHSMPMVNITWDEARRYCAWAGGRLPTEAEWEYAARGGSPDARYGNLADIAWVKDNSDGHTHDVARKRPNAFGLFDILGDVWEWVSDWYDGNYYLNGPSQDPPGPAAGQQRVLRGGAWIVDPRFVRASQRYQFAPEVRSDYFGFRCAQGPSAP